MTDSPERILGRLDATVSALRDALAAHQAEEVANLASVSARVEDLQRDLRRTTAKLDEVIAESNRAKGAIKVLMWLAPIVGAAASSALGWVVPKAIALLSRLG